MVHENPTGVSVVRLPFSFMSFHTADPSIIITASEQEKKQKTKYLYRLLLFFNN